MAKTYRWSGDLVALPLFGEEKPLDGFWMHGEKRKRTLIIYVHGMGGDFFHQGLLKELLQQSEKERADILTFNNRGWSWHVQDEQFTDCLADIDAAVEFGRKRGYKRFVLMGHSSGCQKCTFWQARRQHPGVKAVVLFAPCDDYALARKEFGRGFDRQVEKVRALVKAGRGEDRLSPRHLGFSARRWLNIADPKATEAKVFDYEGRLTHFKQLRCKVVVVFGDAEEYSVLPVQEMGRRLQKCTKSADFHYLEIPGGDHGFHGATKKAVVRVLETLQL